ncbi:MAG: glycosyltransferase family 2 protein [archaeon]
MQLSIVIPAYNEGMAIEQTLRHTLKEKENLRKAGINRTEIIVVNDGSTDSTEEKIKKFNGKNVRLISHETNKGYGATLKTGFNNSKGELIAFFDADGTYPINRLSDLCRKLIEENADMVIGSRLDKGTKMPRQRYFGNKFFAFFLSFLSSSKVIDIASGMRVFKKKLVNQFNSLPDDLTFTPAMSAEAVHEDWKLLYVPISYGRRIGESKLNSFQEGINYIFSILNVVKLYNPLKLFGLIGVLFVLAGLTLFSPFILHSIPITEFGVRRIFFIITFFLIGVNLIFFGFMANFMVKLFYEKLHTAVAYKWAYDRFFLTRYNILGLIFFFIGLGIIFNSLIFSHWLIPVMGILLVLIGVQLVASSMIVRILKELYEKRIKINE